MTTVQGHRGCRGLLPENTIASFVKATQLGCTILELDVVITKDNKVLVSHDAFLNHEICIDKKGNSIPKEMEMMYNLYQMDYDEIREFDCGLLPHKRFLNQENIPAYKPLLKDVVSAVHTINSDVKFNIEIKSEQEYDSILHPAPRKFGALLLKELTDMDLLDKCIIQSFDARPLAIIREQFPNVFIALIAGKNSFEENINSLSFKPAAYCAHYSLVDKLLTEKVKANNMQLFVWTVNHEKEMNRLIALKVDSIITDYPDVLLNKLKPL